MNEKLEPTPPKFRAWQGTRQQILIGVVLATIVVAVIEANSDYDEECGWSLMGTVVAHYGSGDRHKIRIGRGRCRLDVELRGEIDFAADNRGVARLGPGASLSIRERLRRERRRLDVERGAGGEPEYTWYVGSLPKEFDDEARDWLSEVLPRIYRTSGLDADGRVEQLRAAGGLDAVFREMDEIESEGVRGAYLKELLARASPPDPPRGGLPVAADELVRILDYGRRQISSDYALGRALDALDPASLASGPVREAWVRALRSIDSDWELRRLLSSTVAKGGLCAEAVDAAITAGRTVSSDHEQSEFLISVARNVRDVPLPPSYFRALESIGSDHDHKRTLIAAFERRGLSQEEAGQLLVTARQISGDFELADLLATFARDAPRGWPLPDSYFEALAKIDSDSAMRRVLETVVEHRRLDRKVAASLLEAARSLSSDFELATFLVRFLEVYPSSAELPAAELERLLGSVDSEHERGKVEEVLGTRETRPSPPVEAEPVEAEPVEAEPGSEMEGQPELEAEGGEEGGLSE